MLLLGASLLLIGPQVDAATGAELAVLALGSLLGLSGFYSLGAPELRTEYAHMALGLLLLASPWALGFDDQGGAWSCWTIGALAVLLGLSSLPPAECGADGPRSVSELTEVSPGSGGRHHRPDPDSQIASATSTSVRRSFTDEE